MSKKILIMFIIFISLFIGFCTPPDEEAPVVRDFNIYTESPTDQPEISIFVDGYDNVAITGWIITIDNETPSLEDERWVEAHPNTYTIPQSGYYYFYAWAKDAAGNISESKQSSYFAYISSTLSVTEETTNWADKYFDVNDAQQEIINDLDFDSNDNVYFVGSGYNLISPDSSFDAWIKKFDKDGNEITSGWNKQIDGVGNGDEANAILIDNEDNIYIALGYGEPGTIPVYCWWLKKYDVDGIEDTTNWDILNTDNCSVWGGPLTITMDNADNLYFAGSGGGLIDPWTSSEDWWIKKYTKSGEEIITGWNKKFHSNGNGTDVIEGIATDNNNNVYAAGYGQDLISGDSQRDWWMKMFAEDGTEDTTNWDKSFDSANDSDKLWDVAVDQIDNVYFCGNARQLVSANSNSDWRIVKYSPDGTELWEKVYDSNEGNDTATNITISEYGFIFVSGFGSNLVDTSSSQDWWIKMFDQDGNELWEGFYDGNGSSEGIYTSGVDSENSLYVAGYGNDLVNGSSGWDWWIKKFIISN